MEDPSIWSGKDYDLLMGRWSQLLATLLVRFATVQDGENVLDVGCGTGSLLQALLDVGPTLTATGIDSSSDFIATCRERFVGVPVELVQGDAQDLPFPTDSFAKAVSLLVLNFVPNPARAVQEMKRVTLPGGAVACAIWDYGDGMEMLRILWDEAVALDQSAAARHEKNMPLCRQGELKDLWTSCGLTAIECKPLTIETHFHSFDDFWAPFLTGIGPSGAYVSGLRKSARTRLKNRLCERLSDGNEDLPFSLSARAWGVSGQVPSE